MAGLTQDIHVYEYGVPGQPTAAGVGANQQLYIGSVALLSGSGSVTAGYLKNAASPGTADIVLGMLAEPAGGTYVQTGPGILGGTTDGAVWANVQPGSFYFQSGTSSDALTAATNGKTVYYGGENANGPIACATSASNTRPVLGIQLPQDPGGVNNYIPGSNYWAVKINPAVLPSI
jgi:hypothetical protein